MVGFNKVLGIKEKLIGYGYDLLKILLIIIFIGIVMIAISTITHASGFTEVWKANQQMGISPTLPTWSFNYGDTGASSFVATLINKSNITGTTSKIYINFTCPDSNGEDMTATICQRLEYTISPNWECVNSTRKNITFNGAYGFTCPNYPATVTSDAIDLGFNSSSNYLFFAYREVTQHYSKTQTVSGLANGCQYVDTPAQESWIQVNRGTSVCTTIIGAIMQISAIYSNDTIPDTQPPKANVTYPLNGSIINSNFFIYGNASDDVNVTSITSNDTIFNLYSGQPLNSLNFIWNFTNSTTILDKVYNINITFSDAVNNKLSLIVNFTVDTTLPSVTISSPTHRQVFTNTSVNFTFICTDNNLFGFDYQVWNSSNYLLSNATRNLTVTSKEIIIPIPLSDYGDGFYNFTGDCVDGHTGEIIKNYPVTTTPSAITIGAFRFESLDLVPLNIDYAKLSDRYTYNFNMGIDRSYRFKVYSPEKIYYISWSKYYGHFIAGNNWIDTMPYYASDVIRQDDHNFIITLKGSDFKFNSLGDLNNISFIRNFAVKRDNSTAELFTPLNNSVYDNTSQITSLNFTYSTKTIPMTTSNCTINIGGIKNISKSGFNANQSVFLNLSSLSNGDYTYRINCSEVYYDTVFYYASPIYNLNINVTTPPTPTTLTVAGEINKFTSIFFLIFLFIAHYILLYLSLKFIFPELMLVSGILGALASFSALLFIDLIHSMGMKMFFVVYILISIGLIYISADGIYRATRREY